MDARTDPYSGAWRATTRQRPPSGGPQPANGGDDMMARVGGWALAALAIALVAVPGLADLAHQKTEVPDPDECFRSVRQGWATALPETGHV
ncbi:MAG: hypothetical protein ACRDV9_11160, partial [Acidimicrobiia bacterium]